MIRCSHCGKLAPSGATSCQGCGMPLVSANGGERMVGVGQSEQPALPAWLESLRAHERPISNSAGEQPFSTDELVDENAMPSWMRQDQSKLVETGNSDAFPALPYNVKPGSIQDGSARVNGLEASSLIDEQALPAWMRNEQENIQPVSGVSGAGLSANSLIQREALPDWMKNLGPAQQPPPPVQQYGLPAQSAVVPTSSADLMSMPQTPPIAPTYHEVAQPPLAQGFTAGDLIDQQALPDWMRGAQEPPGQVRPVPIGNGFSAGDLIDQRSVPKWMQEQQAREKSGSVPAMGVPVTGMGQGTGMEQGMFGDEGIPASMLADQQILSNWTPENAANAAFVPERQASERMAAGSLIDPNSLPGWLRNTDTPQQSSGVRNGPPSRIEGGRVPSRPRGEIGQKDQSEIAANVFASMLGVAASTPNPTPQGMPPFPTSGFEGGTMQPARPVQPNWQPPSQQGTQPPAWQFSGSMPQLDNRGGAAPEFNPALMGNLPGDMGRAQTNMPQQPGTSYGYMGVPEAQRPDAGTQGPGMSSNYRGNSPEGPKKKGIFEAIRDFFFK